MTICTAFNSAYRAMGELCLRSIVDFCIKHPATRMACGFIPDDYGYPPSWFKIELIEDLLTCADRVLWLDADSLLIGEQSPYIIVDSATLNIAKDGNGINCGVMAWRDNTMARTALRRIRDLREQFRDHQWWEQAALATFIDELDVHFQHKRIFNAAPAEVAPDTQIVHFAGIPHPERLAAMTQYDNQRRALC